MRPETANYYTNLTRTREVDVVSIDALGKARHGQPVRYSHLMSVSGPVYAGLVMQGTHKYEVWRVPSVGRGCRRLQQPVMVEHRIRRGESLLTAENVWIVRAGLDVDTND